MAIIDLSRSIGFDYEETNPNVDLIRRFMNTIGQPEWSDLLHEDILVEFPYGPSIGVKETIAGKDLVITYLTALHQKMGHFGWQELEIVETKDPNLFFAEYWTILPTYGGGKYKQVYINKLRVKDSKIIGMREFWDPKRIIDADHY